MVAKFMQLILIIKRIIVLNSKLEMLSYLTFNEANNWRGLKIDKNKKMYVTGFKKA